MALADMTYKIVVHISLYAHDTRETITQDAVLRRHARRRISTESVGKNEVAVDRNEPNSYITTNQVTAPHFSQLTAAAIYLSNHRNPCFLTN